MKLFGVISVDFVVIDQELTRYSAFIMYWGKEGSTILFIGLESL
jgi:hypothetical protein